MNNAFARIGRTCVSMVLAGGLSAVALFAGSANTVTINLPHAVEVGGTTLPCGTYTISSLNVTGEHLFLVRSEQGSAVTLQGRPVSAETSNTTKVEFSTSGNAWHFQKLTIQGETTGYEFID